MEQAAEVESLVDIIADAVVRKIDERRQIEQLAEAVVAYIEEGRARRERENAVAPASAAAGPAGTMERGPRAPKPKGTPRKGAGKKRTAPAKKDSGLGKSDATRTKPQAPARSRPKAASPNDRKKAASAR